MESFGIIFVAPLWGLISTQLFFQIWIELAKAGIYLAGLMKATVPPKHNLPRLGMALATSVICAVLLCAGIWLLYVRYPEMSNDAHKIFYWTVVALAAIYIIRRIPSKLRRAKRYAFVPGAIEDDAAADKIDAGSEIEGAD